jgi:thiol-disulfide isomerase/thioredoxin
MSYLLPHLHSGWAVDQAILGEEDRVVILRFGHDWDTQCMQMDEVLASVADQIKNFAVIFLVDISKVPDFNTMYELYDPCTCMFFFRWVQGRLCVLVYFLQGTFSLVARNACQSVLSSKKTQVHTNHDIKKNVFAWWTLGNATLHCIQISKDLNMFMRMYVCTGTA